MDILICDPDATARDTVARALRLEGHRVFATLSCEEAYEVLETALCDAVLVAIDAAPSEGERLARRIHGLRGASTLRMVARTRDPSREATCRAMQAGYARVVVDPVEFAQLSELLCGAPASANGRDAAAGS